jgi:hypothetical protein
VSERSLVVRRLLLALVVVAALGAGAGCGGGGGGNGDGGPRGGGGGETPLELIGVITDLSGSGDNIDGFTLRTDDGQMHQIMLDPAIDYGFKLDLLEEHQRAGNRIRVGVERRNNQLFATLILNA